MPSVATPIILFGLSTRSLPRFLVANSKKKGLAQVLNGMEATIMPSRWLASASEGPGRNPSNSTAVKLSELSLEICTKHLPIRQSNSYYQDEACKVISQKIKVLRNEAMVYLKRKQPRLGAQIRMLVEMTSFHSGNRKQLLRIYIPALKTLESSSSDSILNMLDRPGQDHRNRRVRCSQSSSWPLGCRVRAWV